MSAETRQSESPYLAMITDASVMSGGDRSGRNWGVLLLTKDELMFVTKSRFRSIGIFGAVGAPGLGLIVGLAEAVTEKIRDAIVDKKLAQLPPPEEFKKHPDTFTIPYQGVSEIVARPLALLLGDIELKFGESIIYINISKKLKREYKKSGLIGTKRKEAYAQDLAAIFTQYSGVDAKAPALDWAYNLKNLGFFLLLLLGFAVLLLIIRAAN